MKLHCYVANKREKEEKKASTTTNNNRKKTSTNIKIISDKKRKIK